MRKELYKSLCERLATLYVTPEGDYGVVEPGTEVPEDWKSAIRHIDLWNHNVEFIEQEEAWERPAVFVEFQPIQWNAIQPGAEYRAEPIVNLHVVTDWKGGASVNSPFKEDSLGVFDLLDSIDEVIVGLQGKTFMDLDLVGSQTNHNHEDIVENIETYQCVAFKSL